MIQLAAACLAVLGGLLSVLVSPWFLLLLVSAAVLVGGGALLFERQLSGVEDAQRADVIRRGLRSMAAVKARSTN